MDPASLVAFIGFGVQVIDVIKRLIEFLDQVKEASSSIQRLKAELKILKDIILAVVTDDKEKLGNASSSTWNAYQKALDAISQQCYTLLAHLEKILPKIGTSRRKRLLKSFIYAYREEELTKLVDSLERAKCSFQLAQLCITNESTARNNRLIQDTNLQLYELTQAIIQQGDRSNVSDTTKLSVMAWKLLSMEPTDIVKEAPTHTEPLREADRLAPASSSAASEKHSRRSSTTDARLQDVQHKQGDRSTILKSKTEATMFHNAWLGTVLVTRRTTVTKSWDEEAQGYEKLHESHQTAIRVRPAPWFTNGAYEINIEEIVARYGGSSINVSLLPLQYAPIIELIHLGNGDLAQLQTALTEHKFSLKDRDICTGKNLLGLSLQALELYWLHSEMSNGPIVNYRKAIIQTSRWLVSQGLLYDFEPEDKFLTSFMHLSASDGDHQEALIENQEYESLLLESTDSSPCLQRAKMLILFAVQNPQHSQQLRETVGDLINEAAVDDNPESLVDVEETFWARESVIDQGVQTVIANSMFRLARIPKRDLEVGRLEVLKQPRRLLYEMLTSKFSTDIADSEEDKADRIICIMNTLRLLRSVTLLEDGYGECLSRVASRSGKSDVWYESLVRVGLDPGRFDARIEEEAAVHDLQPNSTELQLQTDEPDCAYLDAAIKYYTISQRAEEMPKSPKPPALSEPTQSESLLSRVATVGVDFISSII